MPNKNQRPSKVFSEELAKPILGNRRKVKRTTLLDTRSDEEVEEDKKRESERIALIAIERLALLANHYGVPSDHNNLGTVLMFHLARDFVPGFQVEWGDKPKVGAKKKWDVVRYAELVADVWLLQREDPDRSDSDAICLLLKEPRFRPRWGTCSKSSLRNRLIEGRKGEHAPIIGNLIQAPLEGKWPWYDEYVRQLLIEHFSINAEVTSHHENSPDSFRD